METPSIGQSQGPALRLVRVDWEGPLSLGDARQKDSPEDFGLYMIEGHNVLYGCKGGLYFGIACDQTFAYRMKQHEWWLRHEQDVAIHLGRPRRGDYKEEPPDWPDWYELIADVEALTINWHGFPYNCQNIWTYSGQALRVQNWCSRGNLQAEYSSDWTPPRPAPDLERAQCRFPRPGLQ